ncbi:hypothetical protein EV363DRAFT_1376332 [Boletus edulis]|nr:hypothetical protein EV363DRAFT_1376332 [Boletus edulis]
MDDERFPSEVAPNERLSQINEEDRHACARHRPSSATTLSSPITLPTDFTGNSAKKVRYCPLVARAAQYPQSRCLLILQGTRQRTFGTVLSWRELRNTVCQDQIDHDTQASYQMDDERFPSQVAPNERLSQINEEDKRATGGFGGSLRAQRKRETLVDRLCRQPEYAKEGSCSSPRDSCRE